MYFFLSHQMKAHHNPFLLPKCRFDWIARRWANWAKIGENSPILQTLPNFSKTIWWIFFILHQMKAHHDRFLQPKRYFDWIAWRWANGAKMGENSPVLQTLPNFSKTIWWIFFLLHQIKAHHHCFLQPKRHFDWIARRWANWAKMGENSPILQTLPNFSKTVW